MGDDNLFAFLALFYAFAVILFVLFNFRKIPVSLVAILMVGSVLETMRACVYLFHGAYDQHFTQVNLNNYAASEFIQTTYMFVLVFILSGFPDPIESYLKIPTEQDKTKVKAYIYFECVLIAIFFVIAGNAWIHGNRDTTMSLAAPTIRFIFPALLFSASIVVLYAIKHLVQREGVSKVIPFLLLCSSLVVFMLIGQRGLIVILSIASILGFYKIGKIKLKLLLIILFLTFAYGVFSRSVADGTFDLDALTNILDIFMRGGDGTKLDSIAFSLVNEATNGTESLSILNEFLTVIPHQIRIDYEFPTVSDYLNSLAVGDYYYNFGNGYNFGNMSIFIVLYGYAGPFVCFFLAYLYKRNFRRLVATNVAADTTFLYVLCLILFLESIGSIHWVIYTIVMISIIRTTSLFFYISNESR